MATPARTENLTGLIEQARATLARATSAAEILEAREQADVAYTAAKLAARLAKYKTAHDEVLEACRMTMADALVIEAGAQVRLADEYDAAQQRGEVAKHSSGRPKIVPVANDLPTAKDVGLTRRQVHEARQVRDAEKATPGIVRKTVEERLKAKEEPTRADVRRAISKPRAAPASKPASTAKPDKPKADKPKRASSDRKTPVLDRAREIVRPLLQGNEACNSRTLQDEHGISHVHFETAIAVERALRDEPPIDVATLSKSAQEKLAIMVKRERQKLEVEIRRELHVEYQKWLADLLVGYRKKEAHHNIIIAQHRGVLTTAEYNLLWSCLHPDSRKSTSEEKLHKAFQLFTKLEKLMVEVKDPVAKYGNLPRAEDLDRLRAENQARRAAERAARRNGASANVARR